VKSNGGGELARRAWLGFVCLAAGGCCTEVPRAEKFFDRSESPVQTLRGFVYAVDTSQWEYAFQCLSSTSKAEITPFKLEAAIRWAKDPVYHEVWVRDLISSCLDRKRTILLDGGRAFITVTTGARGRQGTGLFQGPPPRVCSGGGRVALRSRRDARRAPARSQLEPSPGRLTEAELRERWWARLRAVSGEKRSFSAPLWASEFFSDFRSRHFGRLPISDSSSAVARNR
jgi:hypothetical protein